jgi:hypothetical protein
MSNALTEICTGHACAHVDMDKTSEIEYMNRDGIILLPDKPKFVGDDSNGDACENMIALKERSDRQCGVKCNADHIGGAVGGAVGIDSEPVSSGVLQCLPGQYAPQNEIECFPICKTPGYKITSGTCHCVKDGRTLGICTHGQYCLPSGVCHTGRRLQTDPDLDAVDTDAGADVGTDAGADSGTNAGGEADGEPTEVGEHGPVLFHEQEVYHCEMFSPEKIQVTGIAPGSVVVSFTMKAWDTQLDEYLNTLSMLVDSGTDVLVQALEARATYISPPLVLDEPEPEPKPEPEPPEPEEDGAPPSPTSPAVREDSSSSGTVTVIVVVVLLLALGGGGGAFLMMQQNLQK